MKGFLSVLGMVALVFAVVFAVSAVTCSQASACDEIGTSASILVEPQAFQVLAVPHVQQVQVFAQPVAVRRQVVVQRSGRFGNRSVQSVRVRGGGVRVRSNGVRVNVLGGGCANGSCNVGSSALFFQ